MENIYERQADLCKIFSNAKRLEIIDLLKDRKMSTNDLMLKTGLSKVSLFQHLNVLKAKGVIIARREGGALSYTIADLRIIDACKLMRQVLMAQLQEQGEKALSMTKKLKERSR